MHIFLGTKEPSAPLGGGLYCSRKLYCSRNLEDVFARSKCGNPIGIISFFWIDDFSTR